MSRGTTIRLFVSSTFRDMQAERNHLASFVFPELRSRCRRRGADFLPVDLRWGVTEDDLERAGPVAASLEALERCGYFLALIGHRSGTVCPPDTIPPEIFEAARRQGQALVTSSYVLDETAEPPVYRLGASRLDPVRIAELTGWLEGAGVPWAGDSVTMREIRHATSGDPGRFRCFFCLRSAPVHTHPAFPTGLAAVFAESDPRARARLDELRELLLDEPPGSVRQYEAEYCGIHLDGAFVPSGISAAEQSAVADLLLTPEECSNAGPGLRQAISDHGTVALSGLESFGQQVLDDLWAQIDEDLATAPPETGLAEVDEVAGFHERFLFERAQGFLGREDIVDRLLAQILDAGRNELIVVHGPPGSGKSSLLAQVAQLLRAQDGAPRVIPYFAGVAPGSTDLTAMLRHLSRELMEPGGEERLPRELDELSARWTQFLGEAGSRGGAVVLVDAVNQLQEPEPAGRRWLPVRTPGHTKLIISTTDLDLLPLSAAERGQVTTVLVPPLLEDECRALIRAFLLARGKRLAESQIEALLTRGPGARLPLYLTVALNELCLFGSFADLTERIRRLPAETPELFGQVLVRLEGEFGPELTDVLLAGIALARTGLLDSELIDLPDLERPLPALHWNRFYRAIEPYAHQRDEEAGATTIRFFHDQLTAAVAARYLGTLPARQEAHARLARLFRLNARDEERQSWRREATRALSELPHHLLGAGMTEPFVATVTDLDFIEAKCAAGLTEGLADDYASGLAHGDLPGDAHAGLESLHDFVVREGHALRSFSAVPGFVRQHLYNLGPALARRERPAGPWFRSVRGPDSPLLAVLDQHRQHVNEVALAPDAGAIVSAALDGTLRRWDIESWRYRSIVATLPEGATSCDVSSDGQTVVSGCLDGHIRIHRGHETVVCEDRFSGRSYRCRLIAGETRILSAGSPGIMLHDAASGKRLDVPSVDSDVYDCSIGPAGQVALACEDGSIRLYDPATNTVTTKASLNEKAFGCSFSADGNRLVAVGGHDLYLMDVKPYGRTCVWDTSDWRTLAGSDRKWPEVAMGCTFLEGSRYAVAFYSGKIEILDAEDDSVSIGLKAHSRHVRSLRPLISPDASYLLTASGDGQIKVWDLARLTGDSPSGGRAIFCAFSNESAAASVWLARLSGFECEFEVADYDFTPETVTEIRRAGLERDYGTAFKIRVFGRDLAPDMPKDVARLSGWRIGSRGVHRSSPFSDWGEYWLVACSARLTDHTFHLVPQIAPEHFNSRNLTWARSVGGVIGLLRHQEVLIIPRGGEAVAAPHDFSRGGRRPDAQPLCQFSRDGTRLHLAYGGEISVLDGRSGMFISSIELDWQISCLAESEQPGRLCIGGMGGELIELDWATGHRIDYDGHRGSVTDCVYASRRHILSIGGDGTVRLWESGSPQPRAVFPTGASLAAFALSPVDDRLVAASVHGDVHFLVLEGLDAAQQPAVAASTELPDSAGLLPRILGGLSVADHLAPELSNINDSGLRAIVLAFVAHILRSGDPDAEVLASAAEVERKVFGPTEVIEQVSQVVRGLARIVNALHHGDLAYAVDVAKRFAWQRTRIVLLAAVYAAADAQGDRAIMQEVADLAAFL